MGADLSRVRFDSRRDHAGVVLQQGRLLLDADWNELVAILERRIRASVADLDSNGPTSGIAGVAVVPRTTPDGFKVTLSSGALSIGRGRMYVDGLLAENHGLDPLVFEAMLAEVQGSTDTPYDKQPYWPVPTALPSTGTHLAYLDVWQREVTHIEAPDLVEQAIGVDTTARTQTVWQVRLHDLGAGGAVCSTPDVSIPGWADVIAPSGARLSADTIPVTDTQDPCALRPTGGYRGLENQTYRVEVHTGGQPGTATFKWSRDNASVVSSVVEVLTGGTAVRPAFLGKDSVLRFKDGDWAEVTDDVRELDQVSGELRKVEVHEEDGTLRFTPALPADLQLSVQQAADRHLRVRRWDQKGQVKSATGTNLDDLDQPLSTGEIHVPASAATAVVLENGVTVSFSSTGADFRPGDHWIFAARTADTSVEKLVAAPPLGIHHHYARLAVVRFPDTESDCRTMWPPSCDCDEGGGGCTDCTACVTPESHASGALTIQEAVQNVKGAGGGTVCLAAGVYHLDSAGVVIDSTSSLRIRGQGLRTVVIARGTGFQVSNSAFVRLEDFTVIGSGTSPGVDLETTVGVTVERLTMLIMGNADRPGTAIALGGTSLRTTLRDNAIIASLGVTGGGEEKKPLLTAELDISDNLLVCETIGVGLDGRVAHLFGNRVSSNTVIRAVEAGIRLLGAIAPGHAVTVDENTLLLGGSGIEVATSGFTVDANDVSGTEASVERRGSGVVVRPSTLGSTRGATRVASNRVRDVGGRGVAVLAPVSSLEVVHNLVERALEGIVMDERARGVSAVVSDNTVTDVGSRKSDKTPGVAGIQVIGCERASVESNVVHGVGSAREVGDGSAGIQVLACIESRVADNSVDRIGFSESGGADVGIAVLGRIVRAQVAGNQARRQPVNVDDDQPSGFRGLLIGSDAGIKEEGAIAVKGYVVGTGSATWAVGPKAAYSVAFTPATVTVDTNIIAGGGKRPTALVGVAGEVVVTGNQFHNRQESGEPALRLLATAATVSANRLRGGRPSGSFDVNPDTCAVLGNLTTNGIRVQGLTLQPRWLDLNPDGF
jgi:hypothetical protein